MTRPRSALSITPPIKNADDLKLAMKYEPPYSDETKQKMKESVASIRKYLQDGEYGKRK